MSKLFDLIDKHKFGIIAVCTAYVGIYIYLQMETYTEYFPIEAFHDGSRVEIPEEDIELKPENIQIPSNYNPGQSVKNVSRDVNDKRKQADENWDRNKSSKEGEQSVKDFEKKLFEQSGGEAERKRIAQEMEQRKKDKNNSTTSTKKENTTQSGGNTAAAGNVAADWLLSSRNPYQNNEWWIRKPSYMCVASGRIMVLIKVNPNGNVVEATIDPSKSSTSDDCLVKYALEYARKSRFDYSENASKLQSGWISYTFVAQ